LFFYNKYVTVNLLQIIYFPELYSLTVILLSFNYVTAKSILL